MKKPAEKRLPFFGIPKVAFCLKPYKKQVLLMLLCGLFSCLVDITMPLFRRYAIDYYVAFKTLDTLLLFILIYMAAVIFSSINTYISCTLATKIEVWIDRDLRNRAFRHLQTLSFSYFNQNSVGYIHSRVISDTGKIGLMFSWTIIEAVWQLSYLIGALVLMLVINPRLALMVISILPFLALFFALFEGGLIRANRQVREINSRITGRFNEGITGARTIKALVIENSMERSFKDLTAEQRSRSVKAAGLRGGFAAGMSFASSLAIAVVLWKGGRIAADEIGTFSMFMSYAEGIMEPVRWIVDVISDLITARVNIERYTALLETRPDVVDSPEVTESYGDCFNPKRENWEPLQGDIEFENVDFVYPDGTEKVLENFNLKIPRGSNVAVVGETGAGKSTIAALICRFYEPTAGRVLIDGKPSKDRSLLWLHSSIGYVLQTPHLFSGTIRENLLYGKPSATDEELREALRLVSAEELVDRLEKGLDTEVGEGGDLLSTGEKQLISFARAIVSNPAILVLDEATASVDTVTEKKLQSAMEKVIKDRTSIVIAHRLSTVVSADVILVVKDGKIVEQGTHSQLMTGGGYYSRLFRRQFETEVADSVLENSAAGKDKGNTPEV